VVAPDEVQQASPPVALSAKLKELRRAKGWTQEQLAGRATELTPNRPVSVDFVRKLERTRPPYALPRRVKTGSFAIESVAKALDVPLEALLLECFSDQELRESCFVYVPERRSRTLANSAVVRGRSFRTFAKSLPTELDELLELPGLLRLRNAEAFAYIFALERKFDSLEMLIVDEPPIIFLDDEDIRQWAAGMRLDSDDRDAFTELVRDYQSHFRHLASTGHKRYQIVLNKRRFVRFLRTKDPSLAAKVIDDIVGMLRSAPLFELVIVDNPHPPPELEVISRHQIIPTSLDETLSVVIRETSMSASKVEFTLIPMPQTLSSVQQDIGQIEQQWSLALDQYRAQQGDDLADYWRSASEVTCQLLLELRRTLVR
jgi:transcriptional regulator with XRE-family HTH domain